MLVGYKSHTADNVNYNCIVILDTYSPTIVI